MTDFVFDLADDEVRRRSAMLGAMEWDPLDAMQSQAAAERLLYSGLDAEQTRILDELKAAGVIP